MLLEKPLCLQDTLLRFVWSVWRQVPWIWPCACLWIFSHSPNTNRWLYPFIGVLGFRGNTINLEQDVSPKVRLIGGWPWPTSNIRLDWGAILRDKSCNYELNEFGVQQSVLSCWMSKSRPAAVTGVGSFPPVYDMNRQEKNSPHTDTQGSYWIMWTKTGGISDSPHFSAQT